MEWMGYCHPIEGNDAGEQSERFKMNINVNVTSNQINLPNGWALAPMPFCREDHGQMLTVTPDGSALCDGAGIIPEDRYVWCAVPPENSVWNQVIALTVNAALIWAAQH